MRQMCRQIVVLVASIIVYVGAVQAAPPGIAVSRVQPTGEKQTWPALRAVVTTDSLTSLFNSVGQVGASPLPRYAGYPYTDSAWTGLAVPPRTNIDYLTWHELWLGGVVGLDTIISYCNTGGSGEFYPTSFSATQMTGNLMPFDGPADYCYWLQFADTVIPGLPRPQEVGGRYKPLNMIASGRVYTWQSGLAARGLLHDYVITNVGRETIRGLYIGIHLDPDVRASDDTVGAGVTDDLAGSFPQENICYFVDNDGEPRESAFPQNISPSRAMGFKLLTVSSPPRDTGFNWAVGWYGTNAPQSYAPRRRGDNRVLGTYGSGYPQGMANCYYVMRTAGWDFDQVLTGTIDANDTVWQYPADTSWCHFGGDASGLYSFGPYDLQPDSSIRYIMSTFVTSQVHHDPHISDFLIYAPELYTANLDMSGLFASAHVADSLAGVLTNPVNAPTGLRLIASGGDSAIVEWDPWVLDNADGCNLYFVEIPRAAYQREGVVPPSFRPADLPEPIRLGREHRHTFTGLSPFKAYACLVANRIGAGEGTLSAPVTFKLPSPAPAPSVTSRYCYYSSEPTTGFKWAYHDSVPLQRFNIYRYADSLAEMNKLAPFYSINELDIPLADSMGVGKFTYYLYSQPVYASVDSSQRSFVDTAACDGCVYVVTAVDTAGFESDFSSPVLTERVYAKTRDILVLTCSGGVYTFVTCDTIKNFYESILTGYDYDVFHYSDSVINSDCLTRSIYCFNWLDFTKYRLVIIDDGIRDAILTSNFEANTQGFTHYLQSGGRLACFGPLASAGQTLGPTLGPGTYARSLPMVQNLLGVDSVLFMGTFYYRFTSDTPFVDTLLGFVQAEAASPEIPTISFDSLRYPFASDLLKHWPVGTPPTASAFVPNRRARTTHLFRSAYPATSFAEGKPAGLMAVVDSTVAFTFGFHLWYMEPQEARALIDWIMQQVPTGVHDPQTEVVPTKFTLAQNYPNPFNASTQIQFCLPEADEILLEIFNITGQRVRTLVNGPIQAGTHVVTWDGTTDSGTEAASGLYLYRLRGQSTTLSRKMLLLK